MAATEGKNLKAVRREKKKRQKMAVHGRAVKSLPSSGILKIVKKPSIAGKIRLRRDT